MKKNNILFLSSMLIFYTFLSSCSSLRETVSQDPKGDTITWKQSIFKDVLIKDSVLFYNSSEIKVESSFFNSTVFAKDGIVNIIDSTNFISTTVPALTPGCLIGIKKDKSGKIIERMMISFFKNKEEYSFIFLKSKDETFVLNSEATIIFNGKIYPVAIKTKNKCFLVVYLNKQKIYIENKTTTNGYQ